MKTLLTLLLTAISLNAATLVWSPNADGSTKYRVYWSKNGGGWESTYVTTTNYVFTSGIGADTNTYRLAVTAVNASFVESELSTELTWPIPYPAPPAINITSREIVGYNRQSNTWTGFTLKWSPIDLATYGAIYYTLKAQSGGVTQTYSSTNNQYTFTTLPVADYSFSVSVTGPGGTSPAGTTYFQSGSKPNRPTGVLLKP